MMNVIFVNFFIISYYFYLIFCFWYFLCVLYTPDLTRLVTFRFWRSKCKFTISLCCLVGSALRVLPAETRLTVYRRFEIPVQCSRQVQSSSAYPRKPPLWMRICFQKFCPNENSLTQNVDIYIKFRLRRLSLKIAIKTQEIYWRQWFSNMIKTLMFL